MSEFLTLDAILAAPDCPEKVVPVPAWGGLVKVKGITKAKQKELNKAATVMVPGADGKAEKKVDEEKLDLLLLAAGLVAPAITFEQAAQFAEKSAGAVDTVLKAILTLSGMTKEAVEEAEKSVS